MNNTAPPDSSFEREGTQTRKAVVPPYWTEDVVVANGIRQHYYRTGSGKQALVFLHGFMLNASWWKRTALALEHEYDVVMVDARGHGKSGGPETGYTQDVLTEDIFALGLSLGLERPILIGHSNGATTALHVAAKYPQWVRALVLEEPPLRAAQTEEMLQNEHYQAWYRSWMGWMQSLKTQTNEEQTASILAQTPPGWPELPVAELEAYVEGVAQFNLQVLQYGTAIQPAITAPEVVAKIACPVLYLSGNPALGGGSDDPALIDKLTQTLGRFRHVHFEEAGHMISATAFERYMAEIRIFLKEILVD